MAGKEENMRTRSDLVGANANALQRILSVYQIIPDDAERPNCRYMDDFSSEGLADVRVGLYEKSRRDQIAGDIGMVATDLTVVHKRYKGYFGFGMELQYRDPSGDTNEALNK